MQTEAYIASTICGQAGEARQPRSLRLLVCNARLRAYHLLGSFYYYK